jgi:hypothetical protein
VLGSRRGTTRGRLPVNSGIHLYLYGAVSPTDGACTFLILPASDTECFQIFLDILAKNFSRKHILLVLDGAGYHNSGELVIPANVTLVFCPRIHPSQIFRSTSGIREKIFKNYAAKSMDEVGDKHVEAALYIERNPKMVKSITSFPYIMKSL